MQYKFEQPITASNLSEAYRVEIQWRNGKIYADEPVHVGGKDTAPDPFTLLLASLASCTLSTLRMYIARKKWNITDIKVSMNLFQETENGFNTTIIRDFHVGHDISEEQKSRLELIASKCPISKLLTKSIAVKTSIN